jgi:amino acid permease
MVVFTIIFVLPMNFKRAYGELTYISACSVGVEGSSVSGESYAIRLWPVSAISCLKYLGNFAYATSCQPVVCEAHLSTVPESKKNFSYAMWSACAAGGILLLSMGIAGYSAFGENVSSNVMLNLGSGPISCIGYTLVVVHLLMYIPNDFIIMRFYGFRLFDLNILQTPTFNYVIATVLLFAIPVGVMAVVPLADVAGAFGLVLDLTGDLPTGFQCFLIPGLVYIRVFPEWSWSPMHIAAILTAMCGGVCMFFCPIVDIVQFVNACESDLGCSSY